MVESVRFAYPLMLDVTGRLVVVVGGGAVAVRKVTGLLEAGAGCVRIVSPEVDPEMPQGVERIHEPYDPRHLEGATLVFAATDSAAVNERVVRDARAAGALVNRADDPESSDCITPAKFQQGEVIVTVSAGSPALAVAIRDDLARRMDARHLKMALSMTVLRPVILSRVPEAQRRHAIFRELAGEEALAVLERSGDDGLREWLAQRYPELKP